MLVFHFGWLAGFYGARSEAVRRLSYGVQSEIWPEFRLRVQRYVNETGFCKFFGKKMLKKCILGDFWGKNDDLLERTCSSICFAVLERVALCPVSSES